MKDKFIYSVSQVVYELKALVETDYQHIQVKGEVTNLSASASGHYYFSLSDKDALISCAFFKYSALKSKTIKKLKNGDQVILTGAINLYPKRGNLQVIVSSLELAGTIGDLKKIFEETKKELAAKGFFDLDKKKKIPSFPSRVGVITAQDSAAFSDFVKICKRRSNSIDIILYPSLVQGEKAHTQLIDGIKAFNSYNNYNNLIKKLNSSNELTDHKVDLIILMRGGGSLEDLWAFNQKDLAFAIADSQVPVLSSVGHEIDYSISDFVADMRCETPSAAAEQITQSYVDLVKKYDDLFNLLKLRTYNQLNSKKYLLSQKSPYSALKRLKDSHLQRERRLGTLRSSLVPERLLGLASKLFYIDEMHGKINYNMSRIKDLKSSQLHHFYSLLESFNPEAVLRRGYSYLETSSGSLVKSTKDFDKLKESSLQVRFHDGTRKVRKDLKE